MFEFVEKASRAAMMACAALLVVRVSNKMGLFDPIKDVFNPKDEDIEVPPSAN